MTPSFSISTKCLSAFMETLPSSRNSLLAIWKVFFHIESKSASLIVKFFLFLFILFLLVYLKNSFPSSFLLLFVHYMCIMKPSLEIEFPPEITLDCLLSLLFVFFTLITMWTILRGVEKNHQNLRFKYSVYKAICYTQERQDWWVGHRELLFHKWIPRD